MVASAASTREPHWSEVAFFVLPIRLTVFANALLTLVFGVILLSARHSWHLYFLGGGYTYQASTALGIENFVAILVGLLGINAAWRNRSDFHFTFLLFGLYRFVNLCTCAVLDFSLIATCEEWITDIQGQIDQHGFSQTMFRISFEGRCGEERRNYMLATYSMIVLYAYLFWVSIKYHRELQRRPDYLFEKRPDELAYYTLGKNFPVAARS
ncbi:unnamed protein product [Amoebophrya sp. A120]|nr:unnamed protein product [Amoebophrya sp. A120]|eukprot:GSA120T00002201001.1